MQTTGGRRIDIVTRGEDGSEFVVENRYGRADHDHLARGLAYAVARRARGLVVVAEERRDEFRAVAQYLDELAEHDPELGRPSTARRRRSCATRPGRGARPEVVTGHRFRREARAPPPERSPAPLEPAEAGFACHLQPRARRPAEVRDERADRGLGGVVEQDLRLHRHVLRQAFGVHTVRLPSLAVAPACSTPTASSWRTSSVLSANTSKVESRVRK